MRITVITPTCDRPVGLALAERFVARQTRPPDEWIVADGGTVRATCTQGQTHLHTPSAPGATNFCDNLLAGVAAARGDLIAFIEDDDWYAPTHLEQLERQLARPGTLAAGDDDQRYYNLAARAWRTYQNLGACLCQTMFRRELLGRFVEIVKERRRLNSYGVDTTFWRAVLSERRALEPSHTVVGIKGLPGRAGLGVGHRPDEKWHADPELRQLRAWIGAHDLETYYRPVLEGAA